MAIFSRATLIPLLSLLVSAPLAAHADLDVSVVGYSDEGPFGIPSFLDLTSNPNATGAITFNGSSLSGGPEVEYTLSINVTADVPLTNATTDTNSGDKGNFTTASVLSLTGGDVNNANKSICIGMFTGLSANITAAAQNLASQDGAGCGQMLSEECVSAISSGVLLGTQSNCAGLSVTVPGICVGQFADDLSGFGFGFGPMSTASDNQSVFYEGASTPLPKGDEAAWTAAATNIWPVILAFVPSDNANSSTSQTQVFFNCIRPDTFSQGTTNPNAKPSGSGSGGSGATGTGTSGSATSSPNSAASRAGLSVAAVLGLGLNLAMMLM